MFNLTFLYQVAHLNHLFFLYTCRNIFPAFSKYVQFQLSSRCKTLGQCAEHVLNKSILNLTHMVFSLKLAQGNSTVYSNYDLDRDFARVFGVINDWHCGQRLQRNIPEVTLNAFVPWPPKFDPLLSLLMAKQDLKGDHGSGPESSELLERRRFKALQSLF